MTDDAHSRLRERRCRACQGDTPALGDDVIGAYLAQVPDWKREGDSLVKTFVFANYYKTVAFVNAVAWIAHQEDHHPDISFGYKSCTVRYSTHAMRGLTENDFICAAKIDALA